MTHRAASIVSMILLAASPALAGPEPIVGTKAPEISAPSWINLPASMKKITSEGLKGKVVLVEFWATW